MGNTMFSYDSLPEPQTPSSLPPPPPPSQEPVIKKKAKQHYVEIIVDKKHYDWLDKCDIEHKWIVIIPLEEIPRHLKRAAEVGSHTTLYMSEQDYLDVEVKLTDIVKQNKGYYIKSHGELISNVTMTSMRRIKLPFVSCILQIVVVPEARSWL